MQITKVVEAGRVYSHADYGDGSVVIEKTDPTITHDAPAAVASGTEVSIAFAIRDFDGEQRSDSGGMLSLDIEGAAVELPVENGGAALLLELHAANTIEQRPPECADCDIPIRLFRPRIADRRGDGSLPHARV